MSNGIKKMRFDEFEVDLSSGELRRGETKIRVQEQPFKVLAILLERPREVVSREELKRRIWPAESFGDFDHAVNVAIAKLRTALGDSAEDPKYVETIPRRGYRFMVDIERPEAIRKTDLESGPAKVSLGGYHRAILICLRAIGGAIVWWHASRHARQRDLTVVRLQETKISRITSDGNIEPVAISPDGRYIAFASTREGKESLRIRQLSSAKSIEIALIDESLSEFGILTGRKRHFLPSARQHRWSDSHTKCRCWERSATWPRTWTVHLIVSPEGKRLAFVRHAPPLEISQLVLAAADGFMKRSSQWALVHPGSFRLSSLVETAGGSHVFCERHCADGICRLGGDRSLEWKRSAPLLHDQRGIGQLGWTANLEDWCPWQRTPLITRELYYLPYPNGVVRKITKWRRNLRGPERLERFTAPRGRIGAGQELSTIRVAPGGDAGRRVQKSTVSSGAARSDGVRGAGVPPRHAKIIFSSWASGDFELWVADPKDGSSQQLTANSGKIFPRPSCPMAPFCFRPRARTGKTRIWRERLMARIRS